MKTKMYKKIIFCAVLSMLLVNCTSHLIPILNNNLSVTNSPDNDTPPQNPLPISIECRKFVCHIF